MKKLLTLMFIVLGMVTMSYGQNTNITDNVYVSFGKPDGKFDTNNYSYGIGFITKQNFLFELGATTFKTDKGSEITPSVNLGYGLPLLDEKHIIIPVAGLTVSNTNLYSLNYGLTFRSHLSNRLSLVYGYTNNEKVRVGISLRTY